jgi:hypothetical protein
MSDFYLAFFRASALGGKEGRGRGGEKEEEERKRSQREIF